MTKKTIDMIDPRGNKASPLASDVSKWETAGWVKVESESTDSNNAQKEINDGQ